MVPKKQIQISDVLKSDQYILIDVRSPGEYCKDTIPGSINLPILSDRNREKVGIAYKELGSERAKMMAFSLNIESFDQYISEFKKCQMTGKKIVIFCWRGGYRSRYVQELLAFSGIETYRIVGGYKNYRRYLNENLPILCKSKKFIMLHGRTGVGKTELLKTLAEKKYPILDLEKLAANAGSVFGNVFYSEAQPEQKKFESRLFNELSKSEKPYVIVESESRRIGSVYIPEEVFEAMLEGKHYLVTTSMQVRVEQIKKDYLHSQADLGTIIEALKNLKKSLGKDRLERMINELEKGIVDGVIEELMQLYYDPLYDKSIIKFEPYAGEIIYTELEEAVSVIEKIVRNKEWK